MSRLPLTEPIIQRFNQALHAARIAGEVEPTAMVLATSDGAGQISTRTVLLKALDGDGFVFFTNLESFKGRQLLSSPRAAATFFWKSTFCQVQLQGDIAQVSDAEAEAYFSTRDRGSQLGAWASLQSRPLESREYLLQRVAEFEQKFAGLEVPRPDYWSGFRLKPDVVEFWYGAEYRLHDRFRYTQSDNEWREQRLYP
ncbi:MAG: pyridoxamine 5'-phosphate oxidase [Xanthomonadales bacterium]|nr:pyridoxamine 5'-phosphate oxidase [Xanthomonadales bacterium]